MQIGRDEELVKLEGDGRFRDWLVWLRSWAGQRCADVGAELFPRCGGVM